MIEFPINIGVPDGKCLKFRVSEFKTDVASRSCSRDSLLADFSLADLPLAD
jgi:hypothetical protein